MCIRDRGYVEHLKDGDFENVVSRRPHVGINAGPGKIVWVTAKEVFLEQTFPDSTGNQLDSYSIIGFRNAIKKDQFIANEGFQTMYKRDPRQSDPRRMGGFKSFKLNLQEKILSLKQWIGQRLLEW